MEDHLGNYVAKLILGPIYQIRGMGYNLIVFFRLLLYVVGLVLLCFLPNEDYSRRMFFDENALMAGLVRREFADQDSIRKFAEEIRNAEDEPYVWFAVPRVVVCTSLLHYSMCCCQ